MGQVTVTVNGRTYRLRCGDGEEERLIALATHVGERVDGLAAEFGQVGDERLLLMAALLMADELWDVREHVEQLEAKTAAAPPPVPSGSVRAQLAARRAAASAPEPLQEEAS